MIGLGCPALLNYIGIFGEVSRCSWKDKIREEHPTGKNSINEWPPVKKTGSTSQGDKIMKTILGIIGSPRKLGNCEITIKAVSREISQPHELKLIRLADFDIRPCKGCYACLFKDTGCVIKDDLTLIQESIIDADALIVAAPTYFLGPNASLKCLLDRGLSLYAHIDRMWGKPAVGIGIAGIPEKEGYTLLGIQSFLKFLLAEVKATTIMYGALPGEIFFNSENQETIKQLASSLFEKTSEKKEPVCPVCGGDTFRFLENNRVRCMLCSNAGTIEMKAETPKFNIEPGATELFLTKEHAIRHKNWLRGMKARFLENKDRLKKISISYLKDGVWIKPPQKVN